VADRVIRIWDVDTAAWCEVVPRRPGLFQVCAHISGDRDSDRLATLRVLVIADVVARAAEDQGLQAFIGHAGGTGSSEAPQLLELAQSALGLRPAVGMAVLSADLPAPCDGPTDLHLTSPDARLDPREDGILAAVGQILVDGGSGAAIWRILSEPGSDPLSIKKALLSAPHHEPADLTVAALSSAREALRIWRRHVAGWAEFPSRPVPPEIRTAIRRFGGQLDTPALIGLLEDVVDDDRVPPGTKFETFVLADRMLGLDLERWIGQPDAESST